MTLTCCTSRKLAAFVVAFICLNALGIACVAYCQTLPGEHTGSLTLSERLDPDGHCSPRPLAQENGSLSFDDNTVDCCPMTLGIVGGPVEKRVTTIKKADTHLSEVVKIVSRPFSVSHRSSPVPEYRGPPVDQRINRVMNCVIRI
ncbi:MAG TPA: hypothetical protein PKD26_03770 [Pyrinomonadaceae bacterium]|nr:hypothetical protein [Pyrinomonadaceae bacterium]